MREFVSIAVALGLLTSVGVSQAADIQIAGKKLVIVDKLVAATKAKAVFVAKDPGVTKGSGTDPAQIDAQLDISYDSASGVFLAPQGSGWLVNKTTVAKYVNKSAPTGGATKVAVIKPAKLAKLVAKSLGDTPIDISSAPSGDVLAVYTVTNGAETNRHCTAFPTCTHKVIAGGTGNKLVCKNGVTAACPSATTTTISSTTTTTIGGPALLGPAFPPPNGNVDYLFSGGPCAACTGGITVEYSNFVPDTTWSELYWGLDPAFLPTAGLDGSPHALTFAGIVGTTATWAGTSDWTNPMDTITYNNVPIELRLTITGLGGAPWVDSTTIPDLDPGVGTGIAAVVDNSASALDFDVLWEFVADIPTDLSGFIALNDVSNGGGQTNSSAGGGFYSRQ